jgi:hypothetical protein
LVNDEIKDLLADSHNILNRWKNFFSHLLNVLHGVSGVKQREIHIAEPSSFEVEITISNFEKYK